MNELPKRSTIPRTKLAYQFPEERPIFWGPNQLILEDGVYVEPSGWRFNELLVAPRVVRFIHDSSDVNAEGGGPTYISSVCTVTHEITVVIDDLAWYQAFFPFVPAGAPGFDFGPTWLSVTNAQYDDYVAAGAAIEIVCSTNSYKIIYFQGSITLSHPSTPNVAVETITATEYLARGYYHTPTGWTTYTFIGPTFETVYFTGYACDPLGLEGGCV